MKKINKIPEGYKMYVKKPIPVKAIQVNEEFEVVTIDGNIVKGKAGSYIIEDMKGKLYPCDKEIFETTYRMVT